MSYYDYRPSKNDGGCDCGKSDVCRTCDATICKHTSTSELYIHMCDCCNYITCTSKWCLKAIRKGEVGHRCCRSFADASDSDSSDSSDSSDDRSY